MITLYRRIVSILFSLLFIFALCACSFPFAPEPTPLPTVDPYAGMIQVPTGSGTLMWAPLHEELEHSPLLPSEFRRDGEFITYTGTERTALRGIDVSEHQQEIDWSLVAASGVDFAFIRAGYRGYSSGDLVEDPFFRQNIEGALQNGIQVGVYFFSQAVSVEEAAEEAEFTLSLISGYDVALPVMFDWEEISYDGARTASLGSADITGFALAFCDAAEAAGYSSGIYAYRYLAYYIYDLTRLEGKTLWIGAPGEYPDFYYTHDVWQYSYTGSIEGIATDVDLNLMFLPEAADVPRSDAPPSPLPPVQEQLTETELAIAEESGETD